MPWNNTPTFLPLHVSCSTFSSVAAPYAIHTRGAPRTGVAVAQPSIINEDVLILGIFENIMN
jgi:hypothetical protein